MINFEKVEFELQKKAEKPWKSKAARGAATAADINEQIVREARGILNKLSLDNFDNLVEKLLDLPFEDNEERISSVDRLLFEKSINEPSFAPLYAKVVRELHIDSKKTYYQTYRVKIMNQWEIEFQKSSTDKTDIKEIEMAIEKTDDESKKESLMEELEELRMRMKKRSLGNVNFIGELYNLVYVSTSRRYKLKMLSPSFMINSITMLLSSLDEVNLECLCKLLTLVGFNLETHINGLEDCNEHMRVKGKEVKFAPEPKWFYNIFNKIYDLSREESLSTRIRFALLDLDNLRHNNWKPRRDLNVSKTICDNCQGQDAATRQLAATSNNIKTTSKQPQQIIEIKEFEKVELHKAEKPWKSKRGAAYTDVNEQIMGQTMGILNKLTPDNFDSLVDKFLKLPIEDNDERISTVVRIIFEKSINEPSYSTGYAIMIHTICKNSQETSKIFRKKILDNCQKEFQRSSKDETDIIEIAIKKTNDESKKQSLKEELEEKRTQLRKRCLGNIRFIGELYKLQMLTPHIMMECVTMLLSMDEENLECLYQLLTTVGLRLEEQIIDVEMSNELKRIRGQEIKFVPEPKWFDKLFNKIYDLSKEESLSFRIRFTLLDLHELRQNNWKPRPRHFY